MSIKYQVVRIKQAFLRRANQHTRPGKWIGAVRSSAPQRGDTIIEVLIALSVIGLTLAAAFGLSNTAVRTGQAAQERTEALKIAESQIDLLKVHHRDGGSNLTTHTYTEFCIDSSQPSTSAAVDSAGSGQPCNGTNGSGGDGLYDITITETDTDTYQILVTWEHANGGPTKLDLFYRVGTL